MMQKVELLKKHDNYKKVWDFLQHEKLKTLWDYI